MFLCTLQCVVCTELLLCTRMSFIRKRARVQKGRIAEQRVGTASDSEHRILHPLDLPICVTLDLSIQSCLYISLSLLSLSVSIFISSYLYISPSVQVPLSFHAPLLKGEAFSEVHLSHPPHPVGCSGTCTFEPKP